VSVPMCLSDLERVNFFPMDLLNNVEPFDLERSNSCDERCISRESSTLLYRKGAGPNF